MRIIYIILFAGLFYNIKVSAQDAWVLKAGKIDPANYYGIAVANGMIGIVSSPEAFKVKSVVLAGAYDVYDEGRISNILTGFNLLNMHFQVNGVELDARNIADLKQELNLKTAAFTTSFDYGDEVSIKYTYYALRQLPFSVLMDVTVTAKKDINIMASNFLEPSDDLKNIKNSYDEVKGTHGAIDLLTATAKSSGDKLLVCASNTFMFNEADSLQPKVLHDGNINSMRFSKQITAGQTYDFSIVGSTITSANNINPVNEAERLTIFAKLQGRQNLVKYHKAAWADLWKSDIRIDGDSQSQQDVHNMLYHLYSSVREGTSYAPPPMGLTSLKFEGHIFWDADVFMFPALLVLHPEIAKSIVEYRYKLLNAAKENAFSHGYKGAMYPWESIDSGIEDDPVWSLTGPIEHHITADVALAVWNYYCVTHDKQWLKARGWPILSATADFWASRVERNGSHHYDIKNVVAADEWREGVDNDAFTNAAAKANLQYAAAAATILGLKANPDWKLVAQNIPILKFPGGVTKEFVTYNGEGIKQADVNLLAYPLKTITDPLQIKKDLAYYETRVPFKGTPSMTQSIFSLLYARLGISDKAYHFFKESYELNLLPPFRVISETKDNKTPYFVTGAGGILQSLLMGFGGLDITPAGIVQVKSKLPANWKSLTLTGVGAERKTYVIKN